MTVTTMMSTMMNIGRSTNAALPFPKRQPSSVHIFQVCELLSSGPQPLAPWFESMRLVKGFKESSKAKRKIVAVEMPEALATMTRPPRKVFPSPISVRVPQRWRAMVVWMPK